MTQTEALYGFYSWIISGSRKHMLGGGHHGGRLHREMAKFCKANDLPELEDNWLDNVTIPDKING